MPGFQAISTVSRKKGLEATTLILRPPGEAASSWEKTGSHRLYLPCHSSRQLRLREGGVFSYLGVGEGRLPPTQERRRGAAQAQSWKGSRASPGPVPSFCSPDSPPPGQGPQREGGRSRVRRQVSQAGALQATCSQPGHFSKLLPEPPFSFHTPSTYNNEKKEPGFGARRPESRDSLWG